ncbi:serine hydrolase [bacterium]|nr:serine hydrolase [bacterium]
MISTNLTRRIFARLLCSITLACALCAAWLPSGVRADDAALPMEDPAAAAQQAQKAAERAAKIAEYEAFVDQVLKQWNVPSAAIGIWVEGQVVLAKGYGQRNVEQKLPANADTIYAIGSETKAFTTMMLAQLCDEGKLDWDEPVRTYLPEFALKDEYASGHLTVRDMVTHRCGLPRHDLLWYGTSFDRDELVRRLRFLEPNAELRESFQYNNLMYVLAGQLIARLDGCSWDESLQRRILTPLGMASATTHVATMQAGANFAESYWENGQADPLKPSLELLPYKDYPSVAAAGALNCSVNDMLKWVALQLGDGKLNGQPFVSAAQLSQMHTMQMASGDPPLSRNAPMMGYGLGWFTTVYRGQYSVQHGGNIDGYSGMTMLFPQHKLGIVVLTNLSGTPVTNILAYNAVDRILELGYNDINERLLKNRDETRAAMAQSQGLAGQSRVEGTSPSHALADYCGTFSEPGYGELKVRLDAAGQLEAQYYSLVFPLSHVHYDSFEVPATAAMGGGTRADFSIDGQGRISACSILLEPQVAAIRFERVAENPLDDPAVAAAIQGDYLIAEMDIHVRRLENGQLIMDVEGQPSATLDPALLSGGAPDPGTLACEFTVREMHGFGVRFILDAATRKCLKLLLLQPDGVYEAARQ